MGDWDIIMQCVSLSMQYQLRVEKWQSQEERWTPRRQNEGTMCESEL